MKKLSTRNRYFQVLIGLGISRRKLDLRGDEDLVKFLVVCGFLTQRVLMKKLYNLRVDYEGKVLYFKDFNVQLEKGEGGIPFWNIFLKTNIVTTKRFVSKVFSSELLGNSENEIDSRLKVYSLWEWKKCDRKNLFVIDNSVFCPGFFNSSFLQFKELSEKEEVKELL
jgi:hypothetical protein